MNAQQDDTRLFDPRINQFLPFVGVELGFTLATADEEQDSRTKAEANEAATDMLEEMKAFPKGSPERIYINTVRMAAVGLSHGLATRIETLKTVVAEKKAHYKDQMQEFVNSPIKGSLLTVGYKLLMLFGFGTVIFALSRYIFSMPQLHHDTAVASGQPQWASLAFAVGLALCGAYIKAWMSARTVRKLTQEMESEIKNARETFLGQAEQQYTICADSCAAAYRSLTGKEPPASTKAFDRLLASAMARCQADLAALIFEPEMPVVKGSSVWDKVFFWRMWTRKKTAATEGAVANTTV